MHIMITISKHITIRKKTDTTLLNFELYGENVKLLLFGMKVIDMILHEIKIINSRFIP
jgi:hypothetical protein